MYICTQNSKKCVCVCVFVLCNLYLALTSAARLKAVQPTCSLSKLISVCCINCQKRVIFSKSWWQITEAFGCSSSAPVSPLNCHVTWRQGTLGLYADEACLFRGFYNRLVTVWRKKRKKQTQRLTQKPQWVQPKKTTPPPPRWTAAETPWTATPPPHMNVVSCPRMASPVRMTN